MTTKRAAFELGLTEHTIARRARILGILKDGRDWQFTPEQFDAIRCYIPLNQRFDRPPRPRAAKLPVIPQDIPQAIQELQRPIQQAKKHPKAGISKFASTYIVRAPRPAEVGATDIPLIKSD